MITYSCDRCGRVVNTSKTPDEGPTPPLEQVRVGTFTADICAQCRVSLITWLQPLPEAQQ